MTHGLMIIKKTKATLYDWVYKKLNKKGRGEGHSQTNTASHNKLGFVLVLLAQHVHDPTELVPHHLLGGNQSFSQKPLEALAI